MHERGNIDVKEVTAKINWVHVALWGGLLNALWELIQCWFLFDMTDWQFWRGSAWMWGAILGDILIVLGVVFIASKITKRSNLAPPNVVGWMVLILIGFTASVVLEWSARKLMLWEYNSVMPSAEIFGIDVGISPIVQITMLPALSAWLASRARSK